MHVSVIPVAWPSICLLLLAVTVFPEQARAALFYIIKYVSKNAVSLAASLAVLHTAHMNSKLYKSKVRAVTVRCGCGANPIRMALPESSYPIRFLSQCPLLLSA